MNDFDPTPALEDLGVPVPEPLELEPQWRVPAGILEVPEHIAEAAREAGVNVINSDADLRRYVEERGYSLVARPPSPNLLDNPDFTPGTVSWSVRNEDGRVGGIDLKTEGPLGVTSADIRKIIESDIKNGVNPKDALGAAKVDPSVVPPSAELHLATAMMDGAVKYGPFNWRENPVQARVYYAAARRHLSQWLDGEDFDPVSNVHHLGHAMACCAIILDAYENGNLDDNRPRSGPAGDMIRSFDTKRRWVDRIRRLFNRG